MPPRMDDELRAMSAVARALEALNPVARHRVVRWANDRYGKWADEGATPQPVEPFAMHQHQAPLAGVDAIGDDDDEPPV